MGSPDLVAETLGLSWVPRMDIPPVNLNLPVPRKVTVRFQIQLEGALQSWWHWKGGLEKDTAPVE